MEDTEKIKIMTPDDVDWPALLREISQPPKSLFFRGAWPPRNVRLARRILEAGGTLISEYDPQKTAAPWCFPERNRLMAGISHATLVIEAQRPSGTFITSRLAGEYDRDVFAVPGEIFSPLSEGPHMLINHGAAIIRNSDDILHELGIQLRVENESKSGNENRDAAESPGQSRLFESIRGDTETEKSLYRIILEAGGKINRDDLSREYSLFRADEAADISEISAALSMMEMNGIVFEKNGMMCITHRRF